MLLEELKIPGAFRLRPDLRTDERGHFARTFCAREFSKLGLIADFPQHSVSYNIQQGTLRGLHLQTAPFGETKLIRCTRGKIFDVVVDARPQSQTCGIWHGEILSPQDAVSLYVPPGCLHGFQTLEDDSEVYYEITPEYRPGSSAGVRFDDPALNIPWPIESKVISSRDLDLPSFAAFVAHAAR